MPLTKIGLVSDLDSIKEVAKLNNLAIVDDAATVLGGKYKELGENLYGKKIDLLSTGSDMEIPNGFSVPFNLTAIYFGMDFMAVYYKSMLNW